MSVNNYPVGTWLIAKGTNRYTIRGKSYKVSKSHGSEVVIEHPNLGLITYTEGEIPIYFLEVKYGQDKVDRQQTRD